MIIDSIDSLLLPVHHKLLLKEACPVMCHCNFDNELINGTNGLITSFIDNFPLIHFPKVNRVQYFLAPGKYFMLSTKTERCYSYL